MPGLLRLSPRATETASRAAVVFVDIVLRWLDRLARPFRSASRRAHRNGQAGTDHHEWRRDLRTRARASPPRAINPSAPISSARIGPAPVPASGGDGGILSGAGDPGVAGAVGVGVGFCSGVTHSTPVVARAVNDGAFVASSVATFS
jgi:hypothetical protein